MTEPVAAYVGVGANLGDARQSVLHAMVALGGLPQSSMTGRSALFVSAPLEAGGADFVNAVVRLDTTLDAHGLLQALQAIEHDFGRERPFRNAPRTLDLDLLLYGQDQIVSAALTVPHPRMSERAFVLMPLLQLDATVVIPGKGLAADYLSHVAQQTIRPL